MSSIKVEPLSKDLRFGSKVHGLTSENVNDEDIRQQIRKIFEQSGVILFKDMERSDELQVSVSSIIGPPQHYAFSRAMQANAEAGRGLVDFRYDGNIVEADGQPIEGWVPWHFDACYTDKLNRGGVLRAIEIPPEGGLTGFVDGIQLYNAISSELRTAFKDVRVLYHHAHATFQNQRFGMPQGYRWTTISERTMSLFESKKNEPRSIHPAIWQRQTGEHVLHVSPWQAVGVHAQENPDGDERLEALCQEIYAKMEAYWHRWDPNDMIAWDNWRFIHSAGGNHPKYKRLVRRTTIEGDYGLGCFERDLASGSSPVATL